MSSMTLHLYCRTSQHFIVQECQNRPLYCYRIPEFSQPNLSFVSVLLLDGKDKVLTTIGGEEELAVVGSLSGTVLIANRLLNCPLEP
ncbi:hypothetical protein J6590_042726 [Homalodisca vitripennis]|nr:hypothetical protein J6590_042726 [Homalodisca vitripennis]